MQIPVKHQANELLVSEQIVSLLGRQNSADLSALRPAMSGADCIDGGLLRYIAARHDGCNLFGPERRIALVNWVIIVQDSRIDIGHVLVTRPRKQHLIFVVVG